MTAALSAAGVATTMAQVYSVNAVGYVNTTLTPGYNLVSNPLNAADNSIAALFGNSLPSQSKVYTFDGATGFTIYTYVVLGGTPRWTVSGPAPLGNETAAKINPGDGVFVKIPGTANVPVTFVGEVAQGTGTTLDNPLPAGLSIKSSKVPQEGTAEALGFPAVNNDKVYKWNSTLNAGAGGYDIYTKFGTSWQPVAQGAPVLKVGEAMFVRKGAAAVWKRDFTVSP